MSESYWCLRNSGNGKPVAVGVPIVGAFVLGFLAHLKGKGVKIALKGSDFEP